MSLIVKTKKINTKDNTTAEISLIKTNTEILNKMKPIVIASISSDLKIQNKQNFHIYLYV